MQRIVIGKPLSVRPQVHCCRMFCQCTQIKRLKTQIKLFLIRFVILVTCLSMRERKHH
jgi:hypothetical protein